MFRSILAITCLAFLCSVTSAMARCEGAIMLLRMHDAYLASVTETGQTRISGARTLIVVVGGSAKALKRQIKKSGIDIEEARLATVMQDGAAIAQLVLTGMPLPRETFQHSQNIKWLSDIVQRSRCKDAIVATDWNEPKSKTSAAPTREFTPSELTDVYLFETIGAVVFLAIAAVGFNKYRSSPGYIIRQLERMPRSPTSLTMPVTYTDADGDMHQTTVTALDLSAGGLKLDWPDAPSSGIVLTVSLSIGERLARIAWSNAYFAGIVFDTALSKRELEAVLSANNQESKTAPEGAASSA